MNLAMWLHRSARRWPNRPAIFDGRERVHDYLGFARHAASGAAWLTESNGLRTGERIAFFMKNNPAYLVWMYAVWWAGAVVVPINSKLNGVEAAWILDDADCTLCVCDGPRAQALRDAGVSDDRLFEPGRHLGAPDFSLPGVPTDCAPDALAWLFYTSGTTGRPKGVMLSHRNLMAMSLNYATEIDPVDGGDAALYAAPMSHGAGLYNMVHVLMGARHVIPAGSRFDPGEVFELARFHRNVSMFVAPTMVRQLLEAARERGDDGDGIKTIVYGGGPMYLADIEAAIARFGQRFVQIYGQGESPMTISFLPRIDHADADHPRFRDRLASVGRAQAIVELRIVDPSGNDCLIGELGEVLVRGDTVMGGYWRNPQASAQSLRDGWLWTGDLGMLDEDGYLTLKDRSRDVIISGGTNIYPREVEEALLQHPDVEEASVIGVPDPHWGEQVIAYVRLGNGCAPSAEALDAHCLKRIARFKRPRRYLFVPRLPKNNNGKTLKTELREQYAALAAGQADRGRQLADRPGNRDNSADTDTGSAT